MRSETRLLDYIDEMAPPVTTEEAIARRQSPTRSWVRVAIAAAVVLLLLGGLVWLRSLDPSVPPATPATSSIPDSVDDLTGEWQPMPLTISSASLQEMDEQCLAFVGSFMSPGLSLVVADARGEGMVHLIYAREDGHMGTCEATVGRDGQIHTEPTSATEPGQVIEDPPLEPTELRVWGGSSNTRSASSEDWWREIMGMAGSEIHRVVAQVPGLPPVVASLGGGWFTLWHPVDSDWGYQLVGLDNAGNEVALIQQESRRALEPASNGHWSDARQEARGVT